MWVNGNEIRRQNSPERNFIPENENICKEFGIRKKIIKLKATINEGIIKIDFRFIFLLDNAPLHYSLKHVFEACFLSFWCRLSGRLLLQQFQKLLLKRLFFPFFPKEQ